MSEERQRKDSELSRVYSEGAWPEPRRQIDEAILAASRRAARARHPVLHRWGAPFALAATVVLGVTLALMVSEHESGRELKDYFRPSEPAAERSAPGRKREIAPRAAPAPQGPAASKPDTGPTIELTPPVLGNEPAPRPAPKAGPVPPAALAKRPLQSPAAGAAKGPAAPAAQAQRRSDAPGEAERADRIRRDLQQLEETRQARDAAPRQPQAQTEMPAASTLSGAADLRGMTSAAVARPPEAWLDDIRKLKAQGRAPEAERELAEFRKRYPDYRVPEDLR